MERLVKIDRKLDADGLSYTADDVIDEFNKYVNDYSLFNFMESVIAKLKQNGKIRTAETYRVTLNSFKKFRQDEDIMLDSLTSKLWKHMKHGIIAVVLPQTQFRFILEYFVRFIIVRLKTTL